VGGARKSDGVCSAHCLRKIASTLQYKHTSKPKVSHILQYTCILFRRDDVDEQIEQFVQDQLSSSSDIQLVRDLYAFYGENTRIIRRVWERLSNHLPVQHIQGSTPPPHNL
jgi:hypothetical protein